MGREPGMIKLIQMLFGESKTQEQHLSAFEAQLMQAAAERARARLEAEGKLQIELEAQREIRERVRTAA
jgi:hypothetical protein